MFAQRQLLAFVTAAELGSFTRAAERIHLSQPALSASIRKLEEIVGLVLFSRNTRSVTLTAAGERFLVHARQILAEMELAISEVRKMALSGRERITIAGLPSLASSLLPRCIARMREAHPEIDLELRDGLAGNLSDWLEAGEVGLALGARPLDETKIEFEPLFDDHLVLIIPSHGRPTTPPRTAPLAEQTRGLAYVAMHDITSVRPLADRALTRAGIAVVPRWTLSHMSSAIAMVRQGLGFTLLPASSVDVFNLGDDVSIRKVEDCARPLGVLWKRPRPSGGALTAFAALLRRDIAALARI
ncbi:LysR family transcriptional regulator [Halotalea alkalilenta]|uniref:LysR family transcriptional regulator n=1 Tax=Halotalea alkalilenta TaxID=376489 RepID=UPI0005BE3A31|nr:LysR family transcriptional regulator [Halotalea alkalilenta]